MAESLVWQQQLVSGHDNHSEEVDDVVVEILSRLPVKSFLRCRTVCKSWRALISDSYFVKKHLTHAVTDDTSNSFRLLLFKLVHDRPRTVDLQGLAGQQDSSTMDILGRCRPIVLGSCNGLICMQGFSNEFTDGSINRGDIFIWNPSTRVTKKVPRHNFPKYLPRFHGVGYDFNNDDYKLIVGGSSGVAIFSLRTGSWRTVEDFKFLNLKGQGCFVNGALHWRDSEGDSTRIISFDLAKKKCEQLCSIVCGPLFQIGIGSIRNCPCYYTLSSVKSMAMTVWVMKEYGKDKPWTIKALRIRIERRRKNQSISIQPQATKEYMSCLYTQMKMSM